jgi:uncharacterized membrane protein YagU involved in acid resistance
MRLSATDSLLKDIVIGTIGGLAGTLAMQAYWKAVTKASGEDPRQKTRKTNGTTTSIALLGTHHKEGESSTEALGRLGWEAVEHEEPADAKKQQLSQLVHWTYGAAQGALYDAVSRRLPGPRWAQGLAWGGAMWLIGDELAVPALGLAEGPIKYPVSQHAHRLGAHLTYGVAAALTSSALHRMLED